LYSYEFSYTFDTVLYQFLETDASDVTIIGRDLELKGLALNLYPLSFFLYSHFKEKREFSKRNVSKKCLFIKSECSTVNNVTSYCLNNSLNINTFHCLASREVGRKYRRIEGTKILYLDI